MLLFLKLYLAHLVADFLLQPDWIAQNKTKTQALLAHGVLHVVVAIAVININLNRWIILAIFCLAIAHAICDYVKAKYTRDEWLAFTLDQLVHLIIIAGVAVFFIPGGIDKTNGLFSLCRSFGEAVPTLECLHSGRIWWWLFRSESDKLFHDSD